ncbi:hypothetical protein KKB43_03815 [Patescibacteria group bacterium]|nr:hypothetical protein [Patescibacteria group bacterium]
MNEKMEKMVKAMVVAGILAIIFSGIATAEPAREKVVKEACYALDGEKDLVCGDKTKIGNWDWMNNLKNNPEEGRFFCLKISRNLFFRKF